MTFGRRGWCCDVLCMSGLPKHEDKAWPNEAFVPKELDLK